GARIEAAGGAALERVAARPVGPIAADERGAHFDDAGGALDRASLAGRADRFGFEALDRRAPEREVPRDGLRELLRLGVGGGRHEDAREGPDGNLGGPQDLALNRHGATATGEEDRREGEPYCALEPCHAFKHRRARAPATR